MRNKTQICVCICTYKRVRYLHRLLTQLERQETADLFRYSIVVVDNDCAGSAKETVESFAKESKECFKYLLQPEQNIAHARNKAIENAKGDFVAFVDDDEFPAENWLVELCSAIEEYKADGILGPVLPEYETKPPEWVIKGKFFERPRHPTGHILDWKSTRTGNVLLRRDLFESDGKWFDPAFGSGGEDRDFFRRKIRQGHVFVWCDEAQVFETVPENRWRRKVMLKRALLRGKMALEGSVSKPRSVVYSAICVGIYAGCLPVFLICCQHVFMKYLIKCCDHLGKVMAFLGIDLVKEKYVS